MLFLTGLTPKSRAPRVQEVGQILAAAALKAGEPLSWIADAMGFKQQSKLSDQVHTHGLNLARLVNVSPVVWRHMLKPLLELVGLSRSDVLAIYDADDEGLRERIEEIEKREAEREAEWQKRLGDIDELERRIRRLLPPEPAETAPKERVA